MARENCWNGLCFGQLVCKDCCKADVQQMPEGDDGAMGLSAEKVSPAETAVQSQTSDGAQPRTLESEPQGSGAAVRALHGGSRWR